MQFFDLSHGENPSPLTLSHTGEREGGKKRGIGAMMAGGDAGKRRAHDLYDTPWEATEALYQAEYTCFAAHGHAWDPACGNGALLDVLDRHGVATIGSDLIPRGVGLPGVRDFLRAPILIAPMIVTNPPFRLAKDFIEHAIGLRAPYLALLLKATFFHAGSRRDLFARHRPARIHPLSWRLDFNGGGAPTMECAWFVWDERHEGGCVYSDPLPRPEALSPFDIQTDLFEERAP